LSRLKYSNVHRPTLRTAIAFYQPPSTVLFLYLLLNETLHTEAEIVGGVVQGFRPKVGTMTLLPFTEEIEALFAGMLQRRPMHRTTLEHAARSVESFLAAALADNIPSSAVTDQGSDNRHAPASSDELATLLSGLKLQDFEQKLRDFGVDSPADLSDVKDTELSETGLKPVQLRQLRAAISAGTLEDTGEETALDVLAALKSFQASGDFAAIVKMMRTRAGSADVQEKACCALALKDLTITDDKNKTRAGINRAVEAVAAAMRAHAESAGVQEAACRALRNLACNNAKNGTRAGTAGAVEAVVAAMRAHSGSADVQKAACLALTYLAGSDEGNETRAGTAGAVEAVTAAMRAHAGSADVQEAACFALENLTRNSAKNKTRAGTAGAVEAVAAAMRAHAGSAGVQEAACRALCNLAGSNEGNRTRAGTAGAVEAVAAAMRAYAGSAGVQEAACWALNNLATTDEGNRTRAGKAGAKELAETALKAHSGNEVVVEQARKFLKIIT
jgi:hypothetical protein